MDVVKAPDLTEAEWEAMTAEAVDLAAEAPAEEKIEGTALTSEVMRSTGNYG